MVVELVITVGPNHIVTCNLSVHNLSTMFGIPAVDSGESKDDTRGLT